MITSPATKRMPPNPAPSAQVSSFPALHTVSPHFRPAFNMAIPNLAITRH